MLIPTKQQQQQIELFFRLIRDDYDRIILHPIIDEFSGAERLGICIVDHNGPDDNEVYLLGLWFLPGDPFFERFEFKRSNGRIITEKPNGFWSIVRKLIKRAKLLWI